MKVQHASAGFERTKDSSRDHGQENSKDRQQEDGGRDRRDW